MIRFRASSLGEIMGDPKEKTETLSKSAKTFLDKMAKEYVYGFSEVVSGKYMDKGMIVEDDAIALYNEVNFVNHSKNTKRLENEWITGECDIFTGKKIIDVKSSWSLPTFPATSAAALAISKERGYDWQVRAYMMLWDVHAAEVAFCMVDTPEELIGYEDEQLHYVSHIQPALRVTTACYERDAAHEDKIIFKVKEARKYLEMMVRQIQTEHPI